MEVFFTPSSPPPVLFLDGWHICNWFGKGEERRRGNPFGTGRTDGRKAKTTLICRIRNTKKKEVFVAFLDWHLGGGGQSASSPHTSFLPSFRSIKNQEIWVSKMESRPSHNGFFWPFVIESRFLEHPTKKSSLRPPKKHSELLLRQGRHDDLTFPTQKTIFIIQIFKPRNISANCVGEDMFFLPTHRFPLPNRQIGRGGLLQRPRYRKTDGAFEPKEMGRGARTQI